MDTTSEPQAIGEVVDALLSGVPPMQRVVFSNPDIDYLTRCYELDPKFIGRMLRIFGEEVVLESLRRFRKGWTEPVFVGICRKVEREL